MSHNHDTPKVPPTDRPSAAGDKVTVGNITNSIVAIGRNARVFIINLFGGVDVVLKEWAIQARRWLRQHWIALIVLCFVQASLCFWFDRYADLYRFELWEQYLVSGAIGLALIAGSTYWQQRHDRPALVLALVATIITTTLIGREIKSVVLPQRFDPAEFGIAVAELGAGDTFERTSESREVSDQIYEFLCQTLRLDAQGIRVLCNDAPPPQNASIVRVRSIGVIDNSQLAQKIGTDLNADIVVWGRLLTSKAGTATIYFQVRATFDRASSPDLPIIVPVINRATDLVVPVVDTDSGQQIVKELVVKQSQVISSFALGVSALLDRRYTEASERFGQAKMIIEDPRVVEQLQISPAGRSLLYYYLGTAYYGLKRVEEGNQQLRQAIAIEPAEPASHISLALGLRSTGQIAESNQHLNIALNKLDAWLHIYPDDVAALYDLAVIYQTQGDYLRAISEYDRVIAIQPTYYIAYLGKGQSAMRAKLPDLAETTFKQAIKVAIQNKKNITLAYINLAYFYQHTNQPELARAAFVQAVATDPTEDLAHYYYAQFLDEQGESAAAEASLQNLIEVSENKGWAYAVTATFYKDYERLQEAEQAYRRALDRTPDDTLSRTYRAEILLKLGRISESETEYLTALAQNTTNYYIPASYAVLLYQQARFAEAATAYERSLKLRPDHYSALSNLGQTYEILGRCEDARLIYQAVIESHTTQGWFSAQEVATAQQKLETLAIRCQ